MAPGPPGFATLVSIFLGKKRQTRQNRQGQNQRNSGKHEGDETQGTRVIEQTENNEEKQGRSKSYNDNRPADGITLFQSEYSK